MSWTISDFNFKKLLNKRVTSSTKRSYEEIGDYTLNVHADEIWSETIPGTPPLTTTSVVEVNTLLTLNEDTTVAGRQSYYATDGLGNRLKDWISDKYDNDPTSTYAIKLYDQDDNEIPATDPSNWLFDYSTGILVLQNTHSSAFGFKISGYRYIGVKGVGAGSVAGSGTIDYIPLWSASSTLTDSIMQQYSTSTIIVNGVLRAQSKSFDIPHPTKPDHRLVYGCLEGPENAAYHRGVASGLFEVEIILPEYWSNLVNDYTVSLTSYGNYSLFVHSKKQNSFIVRRCGYSFFRKNFIEFSFIVIGDRIDAPLVTEYKI